jgi:peptidoglycan hydrolase CwlO-like protein
LQKDEISVIRTDDDNLSDPALKDTALDDLDEKDKVFEDEIKQFDEDESKIEIIEETDIEYEKELEQISKKILELQSKIKSLEAQGKSYTKKLEGMLEE